MTKQEAIDKVEEYLREAGETNESEEFIRGWKCAMLVALELIGNIKSLNDM